MKRVYEAEDGTTFATAAECREYEAVSFPVLLAELSTGQVESALSLADHDLADAFERIGYLISKKRRKNGVLKRRHKAGVRI